MPSVNAVHVHGIARGREGSGGVAVGLGVLALAKTRENCGEVFGAQVAVENVDAEDGGDDLVGWAGCVGDGGEEVVFELLGGLMLIGEGFRDEGGGGEG